MFMDKPKIAVIGLGYVGLPLAVAFSEEFDVVAFDVSKTRIDNLLVGIDETNEVERYELESRDKLFFTNDETEIASCNTYVVTVPTPIDKFHVPDLSFILDATRLIGRYLKNGDLVVYESTVYPGVTDETCVPILSKLSGLQFNEEFSVGYSPERINPGDKLHRLKDITKVISASNENALHRMELLYSSIIDAGIHKTKSIKEAEAAKIIENTQRDLNIALVNELYKLFSTMGLDTNAIIDAASTKWNFLDFRPGLVGGHCIGVDPYYLLYKANELGFHPEVIHSGRKTNDTMSQFIAARFLKILRNAPKVDAVKPHILILGFTFKENCPDIRNTKVLEFRKELVEGGCSVSIYDPICDQKLVEHEYGFSLLNDLEISEKFDGVAIMVGHSELKALGHDYIISLAKHHAPIFDFKNIFKCPEFYT